jgi:hypothetical protein
MDHFFPTAGCCWLCLEARLPSLDLSICWCGNPVGYSHGWDTLTEISLLWRELRPVGLARLDTADPGNRAWTSLYPLFTPAEVLIQ